MKKTLLTLALILAGSCMTFAQSNKEVKYRRSSLYTIMIPDQNLDPVARKNILSTFESMPLPDKYNNHNLNLRNAFGVYNISVTPEEIKKIEELTGKKKPSKFGKALKSTANTAAEVVTGKEKKDKLSDVEYIARLMKFFENNKTAHKIVEKWYNVDTVAFTANLDLINERGLYSAGEEEKAVAKDTKMGINKLQDAAAAELLPKTFVMVTRYSYLPAKEIIELVAGPATIAAAAAGGPAAMAANKTLQVLEQTIKGYFVKTSSYLFRLKWNEELQNKIESGPEEGGYWGDKFDINKFEENKDYAMEYVGKTWSYAPVTLKLSLKEGEDDALIERATVRATDKSITQLQKNYEEFRAFSPVQVDDEGNCYAYVGIKEGIKEGDKFEILMPEINKEGKTEFKKIASVKALKGQIWDNRFGAGKKLEGETEENEKDAGNASLKYTSFSKNKKIMSGMLLKQTK